jgi:hypothetical protein
MSKLEIERLLFGNRNGAVVLEFIGADVSLQLLWCEFIENLETIQVWGERPCKRRIMMPSTTMSISTLVICSN